MDMYIYVSEAWLSRMIFFLGNMITFYLYKAQLSEMLHPARKSHSQGTNFEN